VTSRSDTGDWLAWQNCSVVQDDGGLSGDALNILRSNTDSSCLQHGGKHPASEFKKDKILLMADSDVEEGVADVQRVRFSDGWSSSSRRVWFRSAVWLWAGERTRCRQSVVDGS
jgi:hypothetical protein